MTIASIIIEIEARIMVSAHLIAAGVLALFAPRPVLRRLKREFEGL